MNVDECIEKYMALSSVAFSLNRPKANIAGRIKDKWTAGGKYSLKSLANEFKTAAEQLEGNADAPLLEQNGTCKVFVCANTKALNRPVLMRPCVADRAVKDISLSGCRIWEAAGATSAATKFFDSMHINMNDYVDGATGISNPVEVVLAEAKELWTDASNKIQCIVSIGTGLSTPRDFGDNLLEIKDILVALCTETERTERRFHVNQADLGVGGRLGNGSSTHAVSD